MKKKWISVLIVAGICAIGVCVVIFSKTFGDNHSLVQTEITENKNVLAQEGENEFEITDKNSGFPIKEETVFIMTDATGKATDILVSEWLKNPKKYEVIKDATNLNEIENVNGEEAFMRSGEELNFKANGADIYYRGVLDKTAETPITLQVSYMLDGEKIEASDLKGKTGHLKMTIQYNNQTNTKIEEDGKLYNVCVPFAVTSVMLIPSEKISNISIENGKVIETGAYNMVLGFGFPGINESFGIEEGIFTDSVVLEGDVEDYSVQTIMTYCSNNAFRDADLEEAINVESVTQSLEKITNSSVENLKEINSMDDLVKSLDEKKDDLIQMNDGAGQINEGAIELNNGANELKSNMIVFDSKMGEASTGAGSLATGSGQASNSSQTLASGAAQVSAGISSLDTGINTMYSGIENAIYVCNIALNLSGGATDYDYLCALETAGVITAEQAIQKATIEAGLTSVLAPLGTNIAGAKAGLATVQIAAINGQSGALLAIKSEMDSANLIASISSLDAGAKQVSSGASALHTGLATLSNKTSELAIAMKQLSAASSLLETGSKDIADGTNKLVDGTAEIKNGTQKLADLFKGDATMFVNTGKALQEAAKKYTTFSALREEEEGTVSFVIKTE